MDNPTANQSPLPPSPPPPKKGAQTLVIVLVLVAVGLVLLLICGGIALAIVLPAMVRTQTAARKTAAVVSLKTVHQAQAQFQLERAYFADSAAVLAEAGVLNAPNLVQAFEPFRDNADTGTQPTHGYLFRMLQGEGADPVGWRVGSKEKGHFQLSSWAATARPALPGEEDGPQFWIGEAGLVYQAEPGQSNQTTNDFLLKAAPIPDQSPEWQLIK